MPALVGRAFGEQVGPGEAEPPALGRPRDASVWGGERDGSGRQEKPVRPRGAFRWRKGCEGDGEQEESVRGWRDGADGRNAKDVRDWTVVSKGDATGHEKSGAIGNRRARAGGGGRAHHRRRGVCCRARDPAARAAGPAKGAWGLRLPGADGRGETAGRTVRPRRPRLRQRRLCAGVLARTAWVNPHKGLRVRNARTAA